MKIKIKFKYNRKNFFNIIKCTHDDKYGDIKRRY